MVTVVGVAWAGNQSSYQSFVDRHGLTFTNLDDTPGDIYSKYKVPYQPAWVFVAKDGTATTRIGVIGESELSKLIQEMNKMMLINQTLCASPKCEPNCQEIIDTFGLFILLKT